MTDSIGDQGLPCPRTAPELLDMYFLDIRSHLLEAASGLDRISRAAKSEEAMNDPRAVQLMKALEVLGKPGTDRAERFLELFSEGE